VSVADAILIRQSHKLCISKLRARKCPIIEFMRRILRATLTALSKSSVASDEEAQEKVTALKDGPALHMWDAKRRVARIGPEGHPRWPVGTAFVMGWRVGAAVFGGLAPHLERRAVSPPAQRRQCWPDKQ
jgi:hypothetical protein